MRVHEMQNGLWYLKYNITAHYTCLLTHFLNKILQVTIVIALFTYLHSLPCYGTITSGSDNQSRSPVIISKDALRFLTILPSVTQMESSPKEPTSFSIVCVWDPPPCSGTHRDLTYATEIRCWTGNIMCVGDIRNKYNFGGEICTDTTQF